MSLSTLHLCHFQSVPVFVSWYYTSLIQSPSLSVVRVVPMCNDWQNRAICIPKTKHLYWRKKADPDWSLDYFWPRLASIWSDTLADSGIVLVVSGVLGSARGPLPVLPIGLVFPILLPTQSLASPTSSPNLKAEVYQKGPPQTAQTSLRPLHDNLKKRDKIPPQWEKSLNQTTTTPLLQMTMLLRPAMARVQKLAESSVHAPAPLQMTTMTTTISRDAKGGRLTSNSFKINRVDTSPSPREKPGS